MSEEKQEKQNKKLSLLLILATNLGSIIGGYVAGQEPAEPVEITCQIAQEIVNSDACEPVELAPEEADEEKSEDSPGESTKEDPEPE